MYDDRAIILKTLQTGVQFLHNMFLHRQKFETQIVFITSLRRWFRSLMENEERFLDPEIQIVFFLQRFTTYFNPMASTFSDSSCMPAATKILAIRTYAGEQLLSKIIT